MKTKQEKNCERGKSKETEKSLQIFKKCSESRRKITYHIRPAHANSREGLNGS